MLVWGWIFDFECFCLGWCVFIECVYVNFVIGCVVFVVFFDGNIGVWINFWDCV